MSSSLLPFFLLRPFLLSLFLFISPFSSPSAGGGSNVGGLERQRWVGAAIDLNVLLRLGSSASATARMDNSAPRSSYCSVASSRATLQQELLGVLLSIPAVLDAHELRRSNNTLRLAAAPARCHLFRPQLSLPSPHRHSEPPRSLPPPTAALVVATG